MGKLTRRSLAKSLTVAGAALALPSQGEYRSAERADSFAPAWIQVFPGIWRARFGSPEAYTPVSGRLVAPDIAGLKSLPAVSAPPLEAVSGRTSRRGTLVELPLRPNEQVYGFGLQMMSYQQRGKKKTLRVNADPRFDTGDSHAPVPFYVTTEGIGVFVDTARYTTFYVGTARPKPEKAASAVDNNNPDPNYTRNVADGDTGLITIEVPEAQGVDVYLFGGPAMMDAVKRYNLFSGGGVKPPKWGLGFWYRSDARANGDAALVLAREFREHKIPCDVWGLEPGWQTHAYSCTFMWNTQRFPDPNEFLKRMKEIDLHVNLWEHAFTHPASPIFPDLKTHAGSYGVWGGLVPDFAAERAREIFGAHHGKTFIDAGVSGFKLDECDNSDYTGGWSFPEASSFPSGVDGEQMHSLFGLRYQAAIWDQYRKRDLETYGLVRSSGSLAAPYPFVLYSDLYNHRDFIRALVNSGFSGLLWCPEVRDAVNEEDLVRRLQSVVFSPVAMVNGWYIKSPPWRQLNRNLNNAGEPMSGWEHTEARCREIIGWRMSLAPYLESAFHRYKSEGIPPFRALILDFPNDGSVAKVDDQFMVGDRMMVAPMFAGEAERKVVIPGGEDWCDFWTGGRVKAGTTLTVPHSFERIPVYVKSGSIVPWAAVGLYSGAPESKQLVVRVYGDGSLPFHFGIDAGGVLSWSGQTGSAQGIDDYSITSWQVLQ